MSEAVAPAAAAKKGIPGWAKAIVAIAILAAVLFAVNKLDLAPKLQAMLDNPDYEVVSVCEPGEATRKQHANDGRVPEGIGRCICSQIQMLSGGAESFADFFNFFEQSFIRNATCRRPPQDCSQARGDW